MVKNKQNRLNGRLLMIWKLLTVVLVVLPLSLGAQDFGAKNEQEKNELQFKYSYAEGLREKMGGNASEAIRHFNTCLEIKPESSATNYELGSLYYMGKDFANADLYATAAFNLEPANIWYGLLNVETTSKLGKMERVAEIYLKLAEKKPDRIDFTLSAVEAMISGKDYTQADKKLNKLEKDPRFTRWAQIKKTEILGQQGHIKKAHKVLFKWLKANSDDIQIRGMLAESLAKYGTKEETLEQYKILKEKDPNNPAIMFSLAQYYYNLGMKKEALSEYLVGFRSTQVNPMIKIQIVMEYLNQQKQQDSLSSEVVQLLETLYKYDQGEPGVDGLYANYLYNEGKYLEAEKIYDRLIPVDQGNFSLWQNMLFIQNEKRDFIKMSEIADKALEIFPNQPLFYMMKGIAEIENKQFPNAINFLKKGLALPSSNPELTKQFYISLGDAYHQMGNNETAFSYFDDLLALDPNNALVLNNYSYYLAVDSLMPEKALTMIKKCIDQEPENPTYLDTYAWVLFRNGFNEKALEVIVKTIRLSDDPSGEVLEHYGDILFVNGQKEKALKVWLQAKEKGETTGDIDNKIKEGIK